MIFKKQQTRQLSSLSLASMSALMRSQIVDAEMRASVSWSQQSWTVFATTAIVGCLNQESAMMGRFFSWLTTTCMSSRLGWVPTSSSKGIRYSPAVTSPKLVRDMSSQRTRPQAYMSMRRKDSRLKLIAPVWGTKMLICISVKNVRKNKHYWQWF